MPQDFDRYELVRKNGTIDQLPFIKIPRARSDIFVEFRVGIDRYEKLAHQKYGNPFFDFLIMYANPEYISEYDIPDGSLIRIPYPLERAKNAYVSELKKIQDQ